MSPPHDRSTPEQSPTASQQIKKKHDKRISLRSLSPAVKRPASDMGAQEREEHSSDVEMDGRSPVVAIAWIDGTEQTPKAKQQNRGMRNSTDEADVQASNPNAHSQTAPSERSASIGTLTTRSIASTVATSITPGADMPSIDEQVEKVTSLALQPAKDKQKGYLVSMKWLNRVRARASAPVVGDKVDKSAAEGDIGPVDNSDIVMVTDDAGKLTDEAGEPFVFLKPGLQMGDDYQILPQEAWSMIVQWYGISDKSPIITRYAHNTSLDVTQENIQYELNPPIFSLLKLPATQGSSKQYLKESNDPPIRDMASRSMPFNAWLRRAKKLTGIDMTTKVRVWRILGGLKSSSKSGMLTPAASRSSSPAPGADIVANAGDKMVLDVTTFASLREGSQREIIEAKDQTANEKYNGSQTLDHAGLGRDDVVVLEEQIGGPAGGEWASEGSKANTLTVAKAASLDKQRGKGATVNGRTSPAPGVVTRGRQRRDGRPKGITGLSNLGNTCYMNSALQCVRSVEELTQYFLHDVYKKDLNPSNPLAHNGEVAKAYANLLAQIYSEANMSSFAPRNIKQTIGKYGPNFSGYGQQDSQEFLLFLLDGLQEDLNRVHKKPYIEKPDSTDEMVHNPKLLQEMADKCWDIYKARNDSVITDLFAGMYKSTVVCPVCDKVSIIFDPFNNLTLQLPIENNWSKEIFYFPLRGKPVRVDVDIDKNASVKALKEYVGKRMKADPEKMIMAEIYKCKFYKLFENPVSIAECGIQPADNIGIFELETKPTNYNADKLSKRTLFASHHDEDLPSADSPEAEKLVVPLFHRFNKPTTIRSQQRQLFGFPSFIIFTKQEARDYGSVQKKILEIVATMTTRDILNEVISAPGETQGSSAEAPEDSDTVVMNDDGNSSDSNAVHAKSVEGEDGLVDVSMSEDLPAVNHVEEKSGTTSPVDTSNAFHPGVFQTSMLQNAFDIKFIHTSEMIPTGMSAVDDGKDYPSITTRLPKPPRRTRHQPGVSMNSSSDISTSSDEDAVEASPSDKMQLSGYGSDEEEEHNKSDSDPDLPSPDSLMNPSPKVSGRRTKRNSHKDRKPVGESSPLEYEGPLVGPGDALLLDWTDDAYNALFEGGESGDGEMRGSPTWLKVELYEDKDLQSKRAMRQSRRRKGISLGDCLDEFGKAEILSENDAWYCPRCKEHRRASKKFELWKVPDILVMHLKRFSSNRNFRDKLEIMVDYPVEGLDMSDRVLIKEEGKELVYDLFAVDNHYGGLGGGHYTAYAKNFFDNNWYEYNDSHVSKRNDPQAVVTPAAYLLFYRRRSSHPLGGPILEKITEDANNPPTEPESAPASRSSSPNADSGEGRRLDGSSRNGSSSALIAAGVAHRAGDGGSAPQKQFQGVSQGDANQQKSKGGMINNDDEEDGERLPVYSADLPTGHQNISTDPMDVDELGDESFQSAYSSYNQAPSWSFDALHGTTSGKHHSTQMSVMPPGDTTNFANDPEEDLFADDASTRAEGAGRSSPGMLSDADDRMAQFDDADDEETEHVETVPFVLGHSNNGTPPSSSPSTKRKGRGVRESAPPPSAGDDDEEDDDDDDDELDVVELKPDGE